MKPVALVADLKFYPHEAISKLEARFDLIESKANNPRELSSELSASDVEVYCCGLRIYVGEELLEEAKTIRYLISPATGVNHLDLGYLASRNIEVIKLGDLKSQIQNVYATAELAWGLIGACARRLSSAVDYVKSGNFDRTPFLGLELSGKTLGVVGFGRLGRQVAGYGNAFGMNVAVYETDMSKREAINPLQSVDSLRELLEISNVISVHVPLDKENKNFIDEKMISAIKLGSIFVNTSRGELVDEQALAAALRSGKLFGVGVDVLSGESDGNFSSLNSPLVQASRDGYNAIVTPHIGGWAENAVHLTRSLVIDEFLRKYQ